MKEHLFDILHGQTVYVRRALDEFKPCIEDYTKKEVIKNNLSFVEIFEHRIILKHRYIINDVLRMHNSDVDKYYVANSKSQLVSFITKPFMKDLNNLRVAIYSGQARESIELVNKIIDSMQTGFIDLREEDEEMIDEDYDN